ncbi:MAG: hypothetical protein ACC628_07875, partial [Pirellulaceae bacterium]
MKEAHNDKPDEANSHPHGKSERIRQFHKACKLLSAEKPPSDNELTAQHKPVAAKEPQTALPHAALKVLGAGVLTAAALLSLLVVLIVRGPLRLVPDYRLGVDYRDAEASDSLYEPQSRKVMIATEGDGVHTVDSRSGFFSQLTHELTGKGLLSDDVLQLERDDQGRIYFLCREDSSRGLCRVDPGTHQWRTLLGLDRFDALTEGDPAPRITSVVNTEKQLWIGTDRVGIGVYDPATHAWTAIHRAGSSGQLLDDRIQDLLAAPDASVWIATPQGLNQATPEQWRSFLHPDSLVGPDVKQLLWNEGKLWYVTSKGGLGSFDGEAWSMIASESRWGNYGDADVRQVGYDPRNDQIWFVADTGHVGRYDRLTRDWTQYDAPPAGHKIAAISVAPTATSSTLRAATSRGVLELDPVTGTWHELGLNGQALTAIDASENMTVAIGQSSSEQGSQAHAYVDDVWRPLIGSGSAQVGPRGALAAALDLDGRRLHVGTDKGISTYDQETHDWIGHRVVSKTESGAATAVVDLQQDRSRILALTDNREIIVWDTSTDEQQTLAGGGRFQGELQEIHSVTRDVSGRLWIAAKAGLFVYDPMTHRWNEVQDAPPSIAQVAASRSAVWMLAEGGVFAAMGDLPPSPVQDGPQRLDRLFASPDSDGAVAMDSQGRVFYFRNTQGYQIVVGDAAKELDLSKVTAMGMLGGTLVVGGARPHSYDTRARSWKALQTGEVVQIEVADGSLWLRTKTNQLFSLTTSNDEPSQVELGVGILAIAGNEDRIAVLGNDGSVHTRRGQGGWQVLIGPAGGPTPELLASDNPVAAAVDRD